jgi:hypothetical protein
MPGLEQPQSLLHGGGGSHAKDSGWSAVLCWSSGYKRIPHLCIPHSTGVFRRSGVSERFSGTCIGCVEGRACWYQGPD